MIIKKLTITITKMILITRISLPHTHSNSTNLALFRRKITLYRFNTIAGGLKWERGGVSSPRAHPHFNHCEQVGICEYVSDRGTACVNDLPM